MNHPSLKRLEGVEGMPRVRLLTLDSNVLITALKQDEKYSDICVSIISKVPESFILCEPSIVYQEVCGTLARRTSIELAEVAMNELDKMIHPLMLVSCDRDFCISAYTLCHEYNIYSIDALYLKVAMDRRAILVSLDREDFTERVKNANPPIEVYHASEFPYI